MSLDYGPLDAAILSAIKHAKSPPGLTALLKNPGVHSAAGLLVGDWDEHGGDWHVEQRLQALRKAGAIRFKRGWQVCR